MKRNSQYYIDKGFIDLNDDAEFRLIADAASCFGKKYNGMQRSYFRHPSEPDKRLWFPKLYPNGEWINEISADESVITSKSVFPEKTQEIVDKIAAAEDYVLIVFGREENDFGNLMYRFKGEYQLDHDMTNYENGHVWRRIATRVKTYPGK